MRLGYLINARMPTPRAHGVQTVRMCEAFARQGLDVDLVHPWRVQGGLRGQDPAAYYRVNDSIRFVALRHPDFLPLAAWRPNGVMDRALRYVDSRLFAARAARFARGRAYDLVFTRNWLEADACSRLGLRTVFEAHAVPKKEGQRQTVLRLTQRENLELTVAISEGVAREMRDLGVSATRLLVAPDAVDSDAYRGLPDRDEARRLLGLPVDRPVAVYTGSLFRWKGVETMMAAAKLLPEVTFLVVGAGDVDQEAFVRKQAARGNVVYAGHVPPGDVPLYQRAADVALLPNSATERIGSHYTSPLKLFEYMAAGLPIVASDVPALREHLADGKTSLLVPPDRPEALAAAVSRLVSDQELRRSLAAAGTSYVQKFTWDARAEAILERLATTSM